MQQQETGDHQNGQSEPSTRTMRRPARSHELSELEQLLKSVRWYRAAFELPAPDGEARS